MPPTAMTRRCSICEPAKIIAGRLPRRETRYVVEWIVQHRVELLRNWDLAVSGQPTFKIEGLNDD